MSSVSYDESGIAIKRYGIKNEKEKNKERRGQATSHVCTGEGEEVQYSIRQKSMTDETRRTEKQCESLSDPKLKRQSDHTRGRITEKRGRRQKNEYSKRKREKNRENETSTELVEKPK